MGIRQVKTAVLSVSVGADAGAEGVPQTTARNGKTRRFWCREKDLPCCVEQCLSFPPRPRIRHKADKDLTQQHSLCLHSQPPLTKAISSKGLSRVESGGTCQKSQDTQTSRFSAAPENEAPSPTLPRTMQACLSQQT